MTDGREPTPRTIPATMVIHQEGVIAVIALVGVWFRDNRMAAAFAARGPMATALAAGAGLGLVCFFLMWLVRGAGAFRDLEAWQRRMVEGWSVGDLVAVAIFSGVAEEALIRALLQPVIGLLPAAAVFAVLHVVPDRRLWIWPLTALLLGLAIGWAFSKWGFPAAAAAHVLINGLSLTRFRLLEKASWKQ